MKLLMSLLIAVFMLVSSSFASRSALEAIDDPLTIQVVAQAYEANRLGFPHGTIRFNLAIGTASSYEDAIDGKWASKSSTEGFCAFDRKQARYETVFSLEEMVRVRKKNGERSWSSPIVSARYLTDGTNTLFETIDPNIDGSKLSLDSQITPGTGVFYRQMLLPIELGQPEPKGSFTRDCKNLRGVLTAGVDEQVSVIPGTEAISPGFFEMSIKATVAGGREVRDTRYKIDLRCGAIPIEQQDQIKNEGGVLKRWMRQDDLRQFGERGWVPFRYHNCPANGFEICRNTL